METATRAMESHVERVAKNLKNQISQGFSTQLESMNEGFENLKLIIVDRTTTPQDTLERRLTHVNRSLANFQSETRTKMESVLISAADSKERDVAMAMTLDAVVDKLVM